MRRTPRNAQGEPPTRSVGERERRLAQKLLGQRGSANRRRTAAKIERERRRGG